MCRLATTRTGGSTGAVSATRRRRSRRLVEGRRRDERRAGLPGAGAMSALDVRAFIVGPVQENTYIVRSEDAPERALIVDPGEEAERLLEAARSLGAQIEAIL